MNLVDSSCWLEYFAGTTDSEAFAGIIEAIDQVIVPSIVLYEVFRKAINTAGEELALDIAAQLNQGVVVSLDADLALEGARLGVLHRLPMADSLIYATAQRYGAVLYTMDAHFKDLSDVRYFPKR